MTSQLLTEQQTAPASLLRQTALRLVFKTSANYAAIPLRAGIASVFFAHGAQKALGLFGGYGWEGTHGFFTQHIGLPSIVASSIILLEFIGPIFILLGLAVRPIALGFLTIMLGSILTVHAQFGFFMNWSGAQAGEGIEFALLAIAMSAALVMSGAGSWSLDRKITPLLEKEKIS